MMNFSRRRLSPIQTKETIDYKNVDLLRQFISEEGKILPRRMTGLTAKQQRSMTRSIKQARILGLLHFVHTEE
jgi:small subunit ribosomal protein S18|tara:strand:- start:423 stop:641 length:219 start_codon:yes stop_codon:yes gene_type:complete